MEGLRNVLFLTYYFPPSGGPGVQRSLKFAKYLPQFGWMPTIVTVRPEHASYPDLDPDLAGEIPGELRVLRTSAWDPYALYARMLQQEKQDLISVAFLGIDEMDARQRLARWIRANVFLPDARIGWVPFAAARGHALLREGRFDAVLTTGPPHSTHLAGLILKLLHDRPWIVDLRDPWTGIDYYADLPMTPAARAVDQWLEGLVLRNADASTIVSESMARRLISRTAIPLRVIENGYDEADFEGEGAAPSTEHFVMRHIGNLNAARNPTALWRALAELGAAKAMPRIRIELTGNVDSGVLESAEEYGVREFIEVRSYVPHEVAVARMRSATLLLLCINRVDGADGIATGKLYEYLASGRPVLGIGPAAGDAARVLGETDGGRMFGFDDVAGVTAYLRASYRAWESGKPLKGAVAERAARYSRRAKARVLADVLAEVANR